MMTSTPEPDPPSLPANSEHGVVENAEALSDPQSIESLLREHPQVVDDRASLTQILTRI